MLDFGIISIRESVNMADFVVFVKLNNIEW